MRRMSSKSEPFSNFIQTRKFVESDFAKIISTSNDLIPVCNLFMRSVNHINITAIPLRLENSLNWPAQNTRPSRPFFISQSRSSSGKLLTTHCIPKKQLVSATSRVQKLRVFRPVEMCNERRVFFHFVQNFEVLIYIVNVYKTVVWSDCQFRVVWRKSQCLNPSFSFFENFDLFPLLQVYYSHWPFFTTNCDEFLIFRHCNWSQFRLFLQIFSDLFSFQFCSFFVYVQL